MKTKNSNTILRLATLGILIAILLLMPYTPIGYLNIGPLAITLNMIPVALAAIILGPAGGAIAGAFFGLTSFFQCIGIGGTSGMGAILFGINPFLAFVQRFLPRLLEGLICGYIYKGFKRKFNAYAACAITGFFCAFLNTLLFMSSLILLFGNTEYVQGLIGGQNIFIFVCTFVGINAVAEFITSTVITGAVGSALVKAKLIPSDKKTEKIRVTDKAKAEKIQI